MPPLVSSVNILDQLNLTGSSLPYIHLRAIKPLVFKPQQEKERKKTENIYSRQVPVIPLDSIKFNRIS
jgi:hypothetical protein